MANPVKRVLRLFGRRSALCAVAAILLLAGRSAQAVEPAQSQPSAAIAWREHIEEDWLKQATAWRRPDEAADAAGAVDGVRNGKYGFHTAQERNPWWQVDLGQSQLVARIVAFNRIDYAPGLHNADSLLILTSDDGAQWRQVYDNRGQHFGGVSGRPPLEAPFPPQAVRARFVRLQLPSARPVFFHLDEVEIFGPAEPARNLALHRPATQSSLSQWSKKSTLDSSALRAAGEHFLDRGRLLSKELSRTGVETAPFDRLFNAAAEALQATPADAPLERSQAVYFQIRWALRRLAFRNPLLNFERLLIVKRFGQETYPDVCLNHMPWVSRPGGDICILTLRGSDQAPLVQPALNGALGPGHVHGMDLSWDGRRIVFGYAKAKSDQPPPGWLDRRESYRLRRTEEPIHIFEIGVDGGGLRQLTRGEWSDLDPTYAPNGDVVFVSERCGTSLQCNEYDKDETSCNLYVMRPDGSGIRRLSVNKDGDYLPHALDDGTIGYTRWEYHERSWAFIQSLWTVRPDGTQADAIFKQHFVNPWALEDVRSVPGTQNQKLACVATGHHTLPAGPVIVVTPGVGVNDPRGMKIVTPDVLPPEGGMDGLPVAEGGVRDPGGYYMHPWPLSEKTFLVSYTFGAGKRGVASEIDPTGYAIYLIDVYGTKELLHRDPAISCFQPVPLQARPRPPILPDQTDPQVPFAMCSLSLAHHGCEGIDPRRIRYLRIAEPIGWPYDNDRGGQRYGEDHRYGGQEGTRKNLINWTPIRILGDVPVEADGSAVFRVPADTAVYFQLLDENRMELRRMRSFISFQPGESRACVGCHESRAAAPVVASAYGHALDREPAAPLSAPWGDRPVSFLRDVQPVLDRHCVGCHSGLRPAGMLDFFAGLTSHDKEVAGYGYNRAFETILEHGLAARSAARAQDASITPPMAYGAHQSKLVCALGDKNHVDEVHLSNADRLRLAAWIDANGPYHDRFVNKRSARPAYDLAGDRSLHDALTAQHARRCAGCHRLADVSRLDWIDFRDPRRSLFLTAPLAKAAGGAGKCSGNVYRTTDDADYQAVLKLVAGCVDRAWSNPRRDLQALSRD